MALVTKIGNLFQKNNEKEDVKEFIASLPNLEEWNNFIEGELRSSNDTNNKNLGG